MQQYERIIKVNNYLFFFRSMTIHRDKFLVNVTNICTEFQFNRYYDFTYFGQAFCPSSRVLSRKTALVHFKGLMPVCYQEEDGIPDDGQKGYPKHVES